MHADDQLVIVKMSGAGWKGSLANMMLTLRNHRAVCN